MVKLDLLGARPAKVRQRLLKERVPSTQSLLFVTVGVQDPIGDSSSTSIASKAIVGDVQSDVPNALVHVLGYR